MFTDLGGFKPVDGLSIVWDECKMNCQCPCGNFMFIGDETTTCKLCGQVYKLRCLLEVREPVARKPSGGCATSSTL